MLTKLSCLFVTCSIIQALLLSNRPAFARRQQADDEDFRAGPQVERKLRINGTDYLITSSAGFTRPRSWGNLRRIDALNPAICGRTPAFAGHNQRPSAFQCPGPMKTRRRKGKKRSDEWAHRYSDGYNVRLGEIPSFVELNFRQPNIDPKKQYYSCGGILISPDLVLTAGHCVAKNLDLMEATAGMVHYDNRLQVQTISVRSYCRLREYAEQADGKLSNDLAVLQLSQKFIYNENVQPACLNYRRRQIQGSVCLAAGFGATGPGTNYSLQLIGLPVRDDCVALNSDADGRSCYIGASDLGFFGKPCIGDSGSGVYCIDNCFGNQARLYAVASVSFGAWGCLKTNPPQYSTFADFSRMADRLEPMLDGCYEP